MTQRFLSSREDTGDSLRNSRLPYQNAIKSKATTKRVVHVKYIFQIWQVDRFLQDSERNISGIDIIVIAARQMSISWAQV